MGELMESVSEGPLWLFNISAPRALLVVAHPDDETIFAGGLILCSRETRSTVVCCTDEGDRVRQDEFCCACRFLAQHSGNPVDPIPLSLVPQRMQALELGEAVKPYAHRYDIVFSHNAQGQYGHEHHKLVHRCVIESIGNPNTWVFISSGSTNVDQEQLKSKIPGGTHHLELASEILTLKVRAFQECHVSQARDYGYDPVSGKLRDSCLKETLSWYFESAGGEESTFFR
jgi:LmbE family N-acetylglucosaminyl deacetylase